MADLAVSLGLGQSLGPNSAITRTLDRLVHFGAARRDGDTLAVRVALPDLPAYRHHRLSAAARLAHRQLAAHRSIPAAPALAPTQAVSL